MNLSLAPPAPLLPTDVWTINNIANKLEVTIDREARSRSRPTRSSPEVDQKKDNDDTPGAGPGGRPQEGGAGLVQSASSASIGPEVAQPPAEDPMSSSAGTDNSTLETFLKSLAAGAKN